jgi:hypothetical protein
MESKEFTVAEVVAYIQDQLLSEKYGIFLDGEAIAAILELDREFMLLQGIHFVQLCDCEEEEHE